MLAGLVPWPLQSRAAPLNPSQQALKEIAAFPLPYVRLGYALFHLPEASAQTLLTLALAAARHVLVADFKPAERNLELPAVLTAQALMSTVHLAQDLKNTLDRVRYGHAAWRSDRSDQWRQTAPIQTGQNKTAPGFLRRGGLEGLMHRTGAIVLERRTLLGGAAVLAHLQGRRPSVA